ncbi:RNA methyltransferase [Plasmodium gonderi]|uniref:RNA methyltransferase n=1 Tax=Plasmodium gonderi TaxID=77519 RepID=A0A1Y1JKF2_PLAGO|nr:RNA methyltransferase [Plasmodium gonderi]GAW82911.1 RNA methyltransferase [Plasmodium gonderi]
MMDKAKKAKKFIDKRVKTCEAKNAKGEEKNDEMEDETQIKGKIFQSHNQETDSGTIHITEKEGVDTVGEKKFTLNEEIKACIEKRIPNVSRNLKVDVYVAIPSSIINNRSDVIKSYLTSYLARIFTVFSISKVYIYDDQCMLERCEKKQKSVIPNQSDYYHKTQEKNKNYHIDRGGINNNQLTGKNYYTCSHEKEEEKKEKNSEYSYLCQYLHYNLQYLETPQYLRKHLFPITNFLKNSGIMNPVDAPHHLRSDEWLPFREGVVIKKKLNSIIVDVGLFANALIDNINNVDVGTRVTVMFHPNSFQLFQKKNANILFSGKLINPITPKLYDLYWGYSVELLKRLSDIFALRVDCIVGTSERGKFLGDVTSSLKSASSILIVFGNKQGLEDLFIKEREEEKNKNYSAEKKTKILNKVLKKFHMFINTCPYQTSRTIRTEEAIAITLSLFHHILT